jgi:hypothetical protein
MLRYLSAVRESFWLCVGSYFNRNLTMSGIFEGQQEVFIAFGREILDYRTFQ